MSRAKQIDGMVTRLTDAEPDARRAAAAGLLAMARKGVSFRKKTKHALLAALDDGEPDVRQVAALALLRGGTSDSAVEGSVDAFERLLAAPEQRGGVLERLVIAARSYRAPAEMFAALVPAWSAILAEPALGEAAGVALNGLARAARRGADLEPAAAALAERLAPGEPHLEEALETVQVALGAGGLSATRFLPAAAALAQASSPLSTRFTAVAIQAEDAARRADQGALAALANQGDAALREATIDGIGRAARHGADVSAAVPLLIRALKDTASGVRYQAIDALWAAVATGADLGAGAADVDQAIDTLTLDDSGWAFGVLPTTGETTASNLSTSVDLARILARHHHNQGDDGALAAMQAAGGIRAYGASRAAS